MGSLSLSLWGGGGGLLRMGTGEGSIAWNIGISGIVKRKQVGFFCQGDDDLTFLMVPIVDGIDGGGFSLSLSLRRRSGSYN